MIKETATLVEKKGMQQQVEDLLQVYKTLALDFPMASMRWAMGTPTDKETTTAVWQGYDAGVRLATSTIDSLYRSQSLSEIVGTTVNQMLRIQQLVNAANSFVVTSFARPFTAPVVTNEQRPALAVDTIDTQLVPTHATVPQRSQKRRARTQLPASTSSSSLSQQGVLQAAA